MEYLYTFLFYFVDGLETTRSWLIPHIDKSIPKPTESDPLFLRNTCSQTLAKAYLELLEWDKNKPYPEVIILINTLNERSSKYNLILIISRLFKWILYAMLI